MSIGEGIVSFVYTTQDQKHQVDGTLKQQSTQTIWTEPWDTRHVQNSCGAWVLLRYNEFFGYLNKKNIRKMKNEWKSVSNTTQHIIDLDSIAKQLQI